MLKRVSTSGWLSGVVWHSTEESRARGLVSVLACAEVAAAVATYWAIYIGRQ
ncbi:MAG: hypothetical protein AAFU49_02830 [Pseudomonadota bacterium]